MDVASSVQPATVVAAPPARDRLESVDLLRGLVMVLMALDHTRDYLHWSQVHGLHPLDLKTTTVAIFFTRWITHFCAPVFIFLAGTGAFLSSTRGKSKRALSWFLVTRGFWLILLELTYIQWAGWNFGIDLHNSAAIVIWAIGWSMIALAALIHLPLWAIATIGIGMVVGHNALDGVKPESWGSLAWLWRVLHAAGPIEYAPGYVLFVGYPLIPWIGVMAAGYAFGSILLRAPEQRRAWVLRLGIALTLAFIVIRFSNFYGDPKPWTPQPRSGFALLSFLDCEKYPPSLCYLLMTLGPALIALALFDRGTPKLLRPLLVFGRVPMFYYLLHIPLVHALAVVVEYIRIGHASWLFGNPFGMAGNPALPPNAGVGLVGVYAASIVAILILYPVCKWFAELKRRRREAWLSYL
jgi:uncharacterized membrane protein